MPHNEFKMQYTVSATPCLLNSAFGIYGVQYSVLFTGFYRKKMHSIKKMLILFLFLELLLSISCKIVFVPRFLSKISLNYDLKWTTWHLEPITFQILGQFILFIQSYKLKSFHSSYSFNFIRQYSVCSKVFWSAKVV